LTSILFYTLIVRDIQESINMLFWLAYFPRSDEWQELRYSLTEPRKIVSGMLLWYKYLCVIFIVVPKMVIISYLAKDGGKWLMRAQSNQDLILNCVALFFITELDEIINKNLVPSAITSIVEEMPDIDWPKGDVMTVCMKLFSMLCGTILPIGIIGGITALSYGANCRWDHANFNSTFSLNVTTLIP